MKKNKILALILSCSMLTAVLLPFGQVEVRAENTVNFKYTQDFSGSIADWDDSDTGRWITSYKKGNTPLSNWSRYENSDGNGMLKLSPSSRPVFWFNSPLTDGNIHLSYEVYYTQSTKNWSYFWGGFQSVAGIEAENGIEIDGSIDNTGLLNGFGIQTNAKEILYGMTTSGGGMTTKACEAEKWYKVDVIHENLGGNLVSKYYIDGKLTHTRTDQSFTGSLYGVTLYSTGNNKENVVYVDNLSVEHYYEQNPFKYTQNFSGGVSAWDDSSTGKWMTSYKKGATPLSGWSRYEDSDGNAMLKLSPNSRPVFWFDSPVRDGNIHLSYDVYYTQSSKTWSYFWGGFQSVAGSETANGIETDGNLDNTGLLNGFGIQTNTNSILYAMTTSGGGMTTQACEAGKWYKLDVIHENIGGNLVSRYYVDGVLVSTRADQSFTGKLYGVALYSTSNNKDNVIYIDNFSVEHYYETEKEAKVTFSDTVIKTNIATAMLGTNSAPSVVTYGDNKCWLMDSDNTNINIIFSPEFKPYFKDGSYYSVEVDYYDIAEKGYFRLYYDALDYNSKTGGTVYTEGSEEWKTAVFNLDDADFEKKVDNRYDLQLSLKALATDGMQTSPVNVPVKEIRVKRIIAKNPVFVTSSTNQTGHTFSWFEESKVVTNTITSFSDDAQNIVVTSKLLDENGREILKQSENISIPAREVKTTTVDIGSVKQCGIYDWVVEVNYSDGLSSCFPPIKIAVIKTDPDGILNDDVYTVIHPNNQTLKQGVEMLKHGNFGGVRSTVYWHYLEKVKGEYSWENHNAKPYFDEIKASGLEILPILMGASGFYGMSLTDMPYTDEELEGWKNYVRELVPILINDYDVKRIEVWNEPDIEHFNPRYFDDISNNGGEPADYAKLFKESKKIIEEFDETVKVGGPTLAGASYISTDRSTWTGHKYFEGVLKNGFADYADAISYHPYGYLGAAVDTSSSMLTGINRFKTKFQQKNSEATPEVWFSETGYTTADSKIDSAYKQGAQNCRTAIFAKANGLSDLTIYYNMEKKGTVEIYREDMFGHVSSGKPGGEKYGTYFVPEKSYLMLSAMNYVMAKTKAKSIHDSQDGTVRISRFSSDKFGKDVLAFYNTNGDSGIKLDLGVNEITYLDCLGNETVMTSNDGIYTFAAEIAPQYIIGDFTKVEYSEESQAFVIKNVDFAASGKATVSVFAENATDNPCTIITVSRKDNHIKQLDIKEEILDAGLNTYTFDIDSSDSDDVLVFLWDGKNDLKPLGLSFTKKITLQTGGKQ